MASVQRYRCDHLPSAARSDYESDVIGPRPEKRRSVHGRSARNQVYGAGGLRETRSPEPAPPSGWFAVGLQFYTATTARKMPWESRTRRGGRAVEGAGLENR